MNIIDMVAVSGSHYGVIFNGANVHQVNGAKHNPGFPHRITIWSNVNRPNKWPEGDWTEHGRRGGPGKYLDPHNKGTDEEISVTMGSESVAITNSGTNTGTVASGQVFGETLTVGELVSLRLPDGSIMGPYLIEQRPLHDPHLTPQV